MKTLRCPQHFSPHPPTPRPPAREGASATVEFVGTLPLLLLGAATCLQALLVACSLLFAQGAADRAARGADRAHAVASLPTAWRSRARVSTDSAQATVRISTPAVLPGVGRLLVVRATSRVEPA